MLSTECEPYSQGRSQPLKNRDSCNTYTSAIVIVMLSVELGN